MSALNALGLNPVPGPLRVIDLALGLALTVVLHPFAVDFTGLSFDDARRERRR